MVKIFNPIRRATTAFDGLAAKGEFEIVNRKCKSDAYVIDVCSAIANMRQAAPKAVSGASVHPRARNNRLGLLSGCFRASFSNYDERFKGVVKINAPSSDDPVGVLDDVLPHGLSPSEAANRRIMLLVAEIRRLRAENDRLERLAYWEGSNSVT